mgnify:CR=1 FL=1
MNFDQFKRVETSNTRKKGTYVKSQSFEDVRYKRNEKEKEGGVLAEEGRFYISNARFEAWGLTGARGLKQFTDPASGATVVAVVNETDAALLKQKGESAKKGKNFKSNRLEQALSKLGVINLASKENQYLKATEVASNASIDGISCIHVLTFTKGEKKAKVLKVESTDGAIAPTPKAPAEPVMETAGQDKDW